MHSRAGIRTPASGRGFGDASEHRLLRLARAAAHALVVLLLLVLAPIAAAGSFSVSPLRIELSPAQRTVALSVHNDSDEPTVVQAQLVSWLQSEGEDRLEPTTDLIASPPIFTLQPGATQTIRIALRRAADATVERTYRILVTEIPGPAQPGFTGARFALKVSLPIFVDSAAGGGAPRLQWTGKRLAGGDVALTVANTGNRHVQLRAIDLGASAADADARSTGLWYVLPGQRRIITMKPVAGRTVASDRVELLADTDAGPVRADVVLD